MNYSKLAFTDGIKAIQQRMGSRNTYERVEKMSFREGLTAVEANFIGQMDSFYIASYGENDFPYIQHRGGPQGFIKVIDNQTIGIVDFSGNRQYISVGNIAKNPRVSLILLSYPMQARLKVYAEAEIIEISDNPDLYDLLTPEDYKFRPERMLIFHIKAYDWNCPQHITPRYTEQEMLPMLQEQNEYVRKLEEEVRVLKSKLAGSTA
ncbi:pyridoxamine 5'-phosphate oxidase family protein [Dyadobacter fanqingshengii]|uniref:Pyridoxamine 5'-phosphate oxidase family protein n=1 Tax=Dyadobacter fanqingshengii TaxID=2906443 RepID=A0A9X1P8P0_9BACT|nr:pyridoxamine 5'-phosphate oxidase family protein [Dyadobacter fanqingshengii]MCF0040075.1 pyridoxamine 5'-phosphate oxidase family protein [Dyadobacter fanqingshengii]USJ38173.1 pyridoxamine 5'-phosphate oxidase family protein [Dyadobacter fanqingshengii]